VVALVGPTGVGKTTTLAKLAANFRLRDGLRMGLVTVDTYRVAAVEQLRTYAEIIDLPMKVVTSPRDMRRALDELQGLDLVLIDTAGRSPRDDLKIQELKSLLAEARVDEVHLVLSLVASARSLEATAEKCAPAGPTSMILTKLDEAVGMGLLMSVARRVPLPVSYLTTGQDVPDDIEPAQARRMARLVLGEENLSARQRAAT
jgi:flagellar biosynthesis protein FlhF